MSDKLLRLSKHHTFYHGYIVYADIELENLPKTIQVNGETLLLKSEFHISLVCVSRLAPLIDEQNPSKIEEEIVAEFNNFIKEGNLEDYKVLKKFRFVQKDIRKTVVVMCEVPGLDKFFELLSSKYKIDLPLQPTHVTLYTLQPERGVGILSQEMLEEISTPVELPEVARTL